MRRQILGAGVRKQRAEDKRLFLSACRYMRELYRRATAKGESKEMASCLEEKQLERREGVRTDAH